jgi:hypothetical protein
VFNLDFIAFGTRDAQTEVRKEFLANMIASQTFDSYSLYLLELFPGSKWYSQRNDASFGKGGGRRPEDFTLTPNQTLLAKLVNPNEQAIMTEYDAIAEMLYSS